MDCRWFPARLLTWAWCAECAREGLLALHTDVGRVGDVEASAEDRLAEIARTIDHHLQGTKADVKSLWRVYQRGGVEVLGEAVQALEGRPWFRVFGGIAGEELADGAWTLEPGQERAAWQLPAREEREPAACMGCGSQYKPPECGGWMLEGEVSREEIETRYPEGPGFWRRFRYRELPRPVLVPAGTAVVPGCGVSGVLGGALPGDRGAAGAETLQATLFVAAGV
jgi:hypothetical protein